MIVQPFVVLLILSVASICRVTGTSYSNVFVESETVPGGYYTYGTPYQSVANPRLSQINSLPSVPGYVAPCVSPCVYPAQTVATVTPVNPSPKVLTYNAPSISSVVAPTKQDATGYEYSYVVYDDNTGDHKAQRELSDGSVVRGEYSFLQPDGFVRQVQYVADDISGFNAVVKQYLPTAVEGHRKVEGQGNKESSPPCHEIKNESLKDELEEDSGEISIKKMMKIHGKLYNKHSNEESAEKSKGHHGTSKESGEDSEAQPHENQLKKPKHSKEESEEKSKQKHHNKSKQVSSKDSEEISQEETLNMKSKDSSAESKEKHHEKAKKESKEAGEESEKDTDSDEPKEELKEKSRKKSYKGSDESREKNKKNLKKGSKETYSDEFGEKSEEVGHGKHKEVDGLLKPIQEVQSLLKPNQEALVPYNDIIRCVEAAMRRNYGVPAAMRQEPSPLTYIVLNKPC